MSHFKLVNSLKVNEEIPVKKYVSNETGIQVYIASVHSPLTNAYLALGESILEFCEIINIFFFFSLTQQPRRMMTTESRTHSSI